MSHKAVSHIESLMCNITRRNVDVNNTALIGEGDDNSHLPEGLLDDSNCALQQGIE